MYIITTLGAICLDNNINPKHTSLVSVIRLRLLGSLLWSACCCILVVVRLLCCELDTIARLIPLCTCCLLLLVVSICCYNPFAIILLLLSVCYYPVCCYMFVIIRLLLSICYYPLWSLLLSVCYDRCYYPFVIILSLLSFCYYPFGLIRLLPLTLETVLLHILIISCTERVKAWESIICALLSLTYILLSSLYQALLLATTTDQQTRTAQQVQSYLFSPLVLPQLLYWWPRWYLFCGQQHYVYIFYTYVYL